MSIPINDYEKNSIILFVIITSGLLYGSPAKHKRRASRNGALFPFGLKARGSYG